MTHLQDPDAPYHSDHRLRSDYLKILYTNADQFVNKRDDLLMLIAGNEPDIILINETIPKAQSLPIGRARLNLPNYTFVTNFDPDASNLGSSGILGITILVSKNLQVSEVSFPDANCIEDLWVRLKLRGNDSLLIGCIYRTARNELRSYTRLLQHNFELGITNDIKLNPNKFWQYVKSRLNTSVTINDIRNDNNDFVTNDYDKAELFNSYFYSVFTDEDSHSLPPFGVSDTVTPIDTVDISLEVVYQKLSSINVSKSAGPDG